jgi:DHA1 family bicyclomycin/chloramphenicol resistance-like MFS transporter
VRNVPTDGKRSGKISDRAVFPVLGILSGIGALSIDAYLPAFPAIAADLAVAESGVQLTLSVFLLGFGVGQTIHGPLSDSLGRRPVILGGLAVYGIASLLCALVQSADQLAALRALQALAAATGSVLARVVIRDLYSGPRLARAMSTLMLILTVAPLMAPALGSLLLGAFGWRSIFVALGVFAFAWSGLILAFVPETHDRARRLPLRIRPVAAAFASVLRHRRAMGYLLCGGFAYAGMFAYITATPFVYSGKFGVGPEGYAALFALNICGMATAAYVNGRLVERIGGDRLLAWLTGLLVAAAAALVVAAATGFAGLWGLAVPLFFYVGSLGAVAANAISGALRFFPHLAGTASSMSGVCQFGLGGLTGWAVASAGDGSALPMAAAILVCGALSAASRRLSA